MHNDKSMSDRILDGREAEYRLNDEFLNRVFDEAVETLVANILRAPVTDRDAVMMAKMELNGLMLVRRRLKAMLDDGILAKEAQDREEATD